MSFRNGLLLRWAVLLLAIMTPVHAQDMVVCDQWFAARESGLDDGSSGPVTIFGSANEVLRVSVFSHGQQAAAVSDDYRFSVTATGPVLPLAWECVGASYRINPFVTTQACTAFTGQGNVSNLLIRFIGPWPTGTGNTPCTKASDTAGARITMELLLDSNPPPGSVATVTAQVTRVAGGDPVPSNNVRSFRVFVGDRLMQGGFE